ncbi:uncharacterized protein EAF01_003368 [Botrytis porri]|uniref:uncharacterized protein n=1 Tax=Botrytis porri TaxID=87229 RepID=UPI001901BC70|nr:uncharacterized protein EAF01_003368 [Botrytis porri]KAF7909650.1 hypothetical protein EAF01_003368 [Botrytis porri]
MAKSTPQKLVKLDGRTGEGGGQLVRIAVSLAALTGTPLLITNVRGKRNGGLKAQHVSATKWLAKITSAETNGCFVGSKTIEFKPNSLHPYTVDRDIEIDADSASSILLVLQAVLPVVLFANDTAAHPVRLSIKGGTNGSFSLSYEYLDQVLLPTLEIFGIYVERQLKVRGWSHGPLKLGHAEFKIHPIPFGQSLKVPNWPTERGSVKEIDISILVLETLQKPLEDALTKHIKQRFPEVKINIILRENTHRIYTLLVVHTYTGLRFGRDWLYDRKTKVRTPEDISAEMAEKVVEDLVSEFEKGALADGRSTILGHELLSDLKSRPDRTDEPFGDGSRHTTTARWVASQMLPQLKWYNNGQTCEGVGWKFNGSNSTMLSDDY